MRLPHGVQLDEDEAQLALSFIRPNRALVVDIKPACDATLDSLLRSGATLGIGRALGLTALRSPVTEAPAQAGTSPTVELKPGATQTARQMPAYRSDKREVTPQPGKGLEFMTRLEQGATLVYAWKTREGAKVLHDFHGEPLGAKNDTFESFIKDAEASDPRLSGGSLHRHARLVLEESDLPANHHRDSSQRLLPRCC